LEHGEIDPIVRTGVSINNRIASVLQQLANGGFSNAGRAGDKEVHLAAPTQSLSNVLLIATMSCLFEKTAHASTEEAWCREVRLPVPMGAVEEKDDRSWVTTEQPDSLRSETNNTVGFFHHDRTRTSKMGK